MRAGSDETHVISSSRGAGSRWGWQQATRDESVGVHAIGDTREAVMAAHRARGRGWSYASVDFSAVPRGRAGRHRAPVHRRRHRPRLAALLATLSVAGGVTLLVPSAQAADVAPDAAVILPSAGPQPGIVMALLLIVIGGVVFAVSRWRHLTGYGHAGRHL